MRRNRYNANPADNCIPELLFYASQPAMVPHHEDKMWNGIGVGVGGHGGVKAAQYQQGVISWDALLGDGDSGVPLQHMTPESPPSLFVVMTIFVTITNTTIITVSNARLQQQRHMRQ